MSDNANGLKYNKPYERVAFRYATDVEMPCDSKDSEAVHIHTPIKYSWFSRIILWVHNKTRRWSYFGYPTVGRGKHKNRRGIDDDGDAK